MSYEVLEKEIQSLPQEYISEVADFIVYLKLKSRFADFEHSSLSYKEALQKWRDDSSSLFSNDDDLNFMQHAFDNIHSNEVYSKKDVW